MTIEGGGSDSLDRVLGKAQATDRTVRVPTCRNKIAAYGPAAIDAIFEWAGDEEFGAFAVTVIEEVGRRGHATAALDALSAFRSIGATDAVRRDPAAAMTRLRPGASSHVAFRAPAHVAPGAGWD